MNSIQKWSVALGFLVATSLPAIAQSQSNTAQSTAGTITSDTDNFMDVQYFNTLDLTNFYGTTNLSLEQFQLGLAKKLGNIYLGTYYSGNFWGGLGSEKEENQIPDTTINSRWAENNYHNFGILFGFGTIGVKLDTNLVFNSTQQNPAYKETIAPNSTIIEKNRKNNYTFTVDVGGV